MKVAELKKFGLKMELYKEIPNTLSGVKQWRDKILQLLKEQNPDPAKMIDDNYHNPNSDNDDDSDSNSCFYSDNDIIVESDSETNSDENSDGNSQSDCDQVVDQNQIDTMDQTAVTNHMHFKKLCNQIKDTKDKTYQYNKILKDDLTTYCTKKQIKPTNGTNKIHYWRGIILHYQSSLSSSSEAAIEAICPAQPPQPSIQPPAETPPPPSRSRARIPSGLPYMANYPEEKQWFDLDFTLWGTPLSRIGIICSCRAGAQLPSCCAHGSSVLWLIYYALFGDLAQVLQISKRDKLVAINVTSLKSYKIYLDQLIKKGTPRICVCCPQKDIKEKVMCDNCKVYYHPECLGTTWEEIVHQDKWTFHMWHCKYCLGDEVFIARTMST